MSGFPVVVVPEGGVPFVQVSDGASVATAVKNRQGLPITLVIEGAPPLIVEGRNLLANGDFEGGSAGWSLGDGNGTLQAIDGQGVVTVVGSYAIFSTAYATEIGKTYRISGEVVGVTGPPVVFWVRKADDAAISTIVSWGYDNTVGSFDGTFVATATTTYLGLGMAGTGATMTVDNLWVEDA